MLQSRFLQVELVFELAEVLTSLVDKLVTTPGVFNGLLPLQVQLVTLLMQAFEFFSCFVKLDLSGLGLSDLLLKLLALRTNFNRQLLDLQSQFFDLGLVSTPVLLKC